MAQIVITIPDEQVERVLVAFADRRGWSPSTLLTRAEYARRQVAQYIRDQVVHSEGVDARNLAEQTATNEVTPT